MVVSRCAETFLSARLSYSPYTDGYGNKHRDNSHAWRPIEPPTPLIHEDTTMGGHQKSPATSQLKGGRNVVQKKI